MFDTISIDDRKGILPTVMVNPKNTSSGEATFHPNSGGINKLKDHDMENNLF